MAKMSIIIVAQILIVDWARFKCMIFVVVDTLVTKICSEGILESLFIFLNRLEISKNIYENSDCAMSFGIQNSMHFDYVLSV